MDIRLFVTGGTIDVERILPGKKYDFERTHVRDMLKQGRNSANVNVEVLMLKDSLYMTEADRERILKKCRKCEESRIVITHGTDTMVETARVLGGGRNN